MTPEEIKGRRITAAVAVLLLVPAVMVLAAAVSGRSVPGGAWIMTFGLQVLLAWLLYRSERWVRLLVIAVCGFGVLAAGIRFVSTDLSVPLRLSILLNAFVNLVVLIVMSASTSVRAYFDRQGAASSLNISGT